MATRRRKYLLAVGTVLSAAAAGCGDGDSDGTDAEDSPPDPIERGYSDGGDRVIELEVELEGPTGIVVQHEGRSEFVVELTDDDGEPLRTLIRENGNWTGANLVGVDPGEYALDLRSDGIWEVTVVQNPRYTPSDVETRLPLAVETIADDFYGPVSFTEPLRISARAEGDGENELVVRDSRGDVTERVLEADGPTDVDSVVSIDDGIGWLDVRTAGFFELAVESAGSNG